MFSKIKYYFIKFLLTLRMAKTYCERCMFWCISKEIRDVIVLLLCDTALCFWKHFKISLSFLKFCPRVIELRGENGRNPDIEHFSFTLFLGRKRRKFLTKEKTVVINAMGIFMRKKKKTNQNKTKTTNNSLWRIILIFTGLTICH